VVEGTSFPAAVVGERMTRSWSEHQLFTTANFSARNRLTIFLTGGLNHQIEHHLFPTVSHAHYAALSLIVRRTAHEHDLPYQEGATFFGALASHVRALRTFGRPSGVAE
jgi:linoleoyl-CoA desaturase